MISALLAVIILASILVLSELLWKRIKVHPELARKFVHITCGTFIAFLPHWVDYRWVIVLSVGFILVNLVNRFTTIFHAIKAVRRKSWGDVLFGVGVLIVALFQPDQWLFTIAILQVSLADGLAALAGVTYGDKHGKYYLFSQPKSIIGSATFLLSSIIILTAGLFASSYFADPLQLWPALIMLPLMLTCVENLAVYGFDNLALPLFTLGVLSLF